MPIPTPSGREQESDYIGRCMEAIGSEYTDKDQALAVCYTQWRESKGLSSQEKMINKMNLKQMELEGACWSDYIQVGMKPGPGGKMVPDCRGPIKK
jgi:hypothetical protein